MIRLINLIAAACLLLLTQCRPGGSKAESKDERSSADAKSASPQPLPPGLPPIDPSLAGKAVLTVWLAADYAGERLFADLNAEFEAAYPGVRVKLLGVPWEDMPTKVKAAIIGGEPPDIAHQHAFALGAQGFAEPLDDLWKAWGAVDEFLPGAIEDVTWRGVSYGVPLDINCLGLFYNRTLYKERGVEPPRSGYTMQQWREDLAKLTGPGGQPYGVGLTTSSWNTFGFIVANGGELMREENGKIRITFTDPKTVDAVRFVAELGERYNYGPKPSSKARDHDDATTLFALGRAATVYTGPWDLATVRKRAPNLSFGVVRFPAGLDGVPRGTVQGGGGLFVPKGSKNRKLAFEWMKWAVSDRYAKRLAHEMARFPVKRGHYKDPYFESDELVRAFVETLPLARPYKLEAFPQAHQAFEDAVKASFYGTDPAVALEKAQTVAQAAVDATEPKP